MEYTPGQIPTPEQIRAARKAAGDTQEKAASRLFAKRRAWTNWEMPITSPEHRDMSALAYEVYLFKTGQIKELSGMKK